MAESLSKQRTRKLKVTFFSSHNFSFLIKIITIFDLKSTVNINAVNGLDIEFSTEHWARRNATVFVSYQFENWMDCIGASNILLRWIFLIVERAVINVYTYTLLVDSTHCMVKRKREKAIASTQELQKIEQKPDKIKRNPLNRHLSTWQRTSHLKIQIYVQNCDDVKNSVLFFGQKWFCINCRLTIIFSSFIYICFCCSSPSSLQLAVSNTFNNLNIQVITWKIAVHIGYVYRYFYVWFILFKVKILNKINSWLV